MSRLDAANYLGLSLKAVSRALSSLERSEVIALKDGAACGAGQDEIRKDCSRDVV